MSSHNVLKHVAYTVVVLGILRPYFRGMIKSVSGVSYIPKDEPFIFCANHESYMDPVLTFIAFTDILQKHIYYLVNSKERSSALRRFFFDITGTVPIDRDSKDASALDVAVGLLRQGENVGLFPEGTRTRDGELQKGKTGAVRLALRSGCPILPVGIVGARELWSRGQRFPKREKGVDINIGRPIYFEKTRETEFSREMLRSMTNRVMERIGELVGKTYVH